MHVKFVLIQELFSLATHVGLLHSFFIFPFSHWSHRNVSSGEQKEAGVIENSLKRIKRSETIIKDTFR